MGSYVLKQAEMGQLSAAMDLINEGKQYLKEQGSDQWQTGYPDETDIREDILRGRGYFVTEEERLLAYLEELSDRTGRRTVTVPFDRQALADYLCVDRSALSRTIGALQREGVLTADRARFTLHNISPSGGA